MMILMILGSHLVVATLIAVLMAGLSSGKVQDLQAELRTIYIGQAEITRRYNRVIASYGLAEPLADVGSSPFDRELPARFQAMDKVGDPAIGVHH